ncbi:MAG: class I SAM-dependent methyltransferase [Gaiellaceae bacterium]
MPFDPEARAPEHLVRFVRSLGEVDAALDVGCGQGLLTRELAATRVLVGADVSGVALSRARTRLPEAVELVELTPGEALPFADNEFELVLCSDTLEHVQDVQQLLSEARRVLRPGGRLAVTTPAHLPLMRAPDPLSPHLRFFTRRSLRRLLRDMGFTVDSLRREAGTLMAVASR